VKAARFLILLLASVGVLYPPDFSAAHTHLFSTTRFFSFDGRRYTLVPSRESDFSLVRRILAKDGIDLPHDSDEDPLPHPALSIAFAKEREDRSPSRIPIPESFGIEHTLRLANDEGVVEIVYGTTRQSSREAVHFLRARGWTCPGPTDRRLEGAIATYSHGKERILAFLEEKGKGFLLVRRVDR
jgi:hypothetical protein